jgi:serine/threonine protein kinase
MLIVHAPACISWCHVLACTHCYFLDTCVLQAIQQALQNKKRSETPNMKWLQITPVEFKAPPKNAEEMQAYFASGMDKELNREDVVIESEIGAGEFGSVCSGYLKKAGESKVTIAIKTLKDGADDSQKTKFLQEALIMVQFNNPKIVSLVGVVTKGEPVLICLEFMELGSLRNYLKSEFVFEKLSDADLIRMACDVCAGMHYLAESGFVHRDLAARNVLVNKDFVCKVADFGLSQNAEEDSNNDKEERIPIRWTSPEAVMQHQFSSASDVWSFGILLWEMWSYGAVPYKGWTNDVVMQNVTKGYRMPSPKNCPQFIYGLMLECWNEDSTERPAFYDIFERLLACWNICKPISNYAKNYTYDANGNRVRSEPAYQQQQQSRAEDFEMEDGDVYDLGGDKDAQIVGKRRIVLDNNNTAGNAEQAFEVKAPTRTAPTLASDDDDDDANGDVYDLGGAKSNKVFVKRASILMDDGPEDQQEESFGFSTDTLPRGPKSAFSDPSGYLQIDDQ